MYVLVVSCIESSTCMIIVTYYYNVLGGWGTYTLQRTMHWADVESSFLCPLSQHSSISAREDVFVSVFVSVSATSRQSRYTPPHSRTESSPHSPYHHSEKVSIPKRSSPSLPQSSHYSQSPYSSKLSYYPISPTTLSSLPPSPSSSSPSGRGQAQEGIRPSLSDSDSDR